jgi:hypothetical protein
MAHIPIKEIDTIKDPLMVQFRTQRKPEWKLEALRRGMFLKSLIERAMSEYLRNHPSPDLL